MSIAITGNTYPVRVELRTLGGVWNKTQKAWMVPEDKAPQARSLVENAAAGSSYRRSPTRYGRHYGSYNAGNYGGGCRCEDYPCCGH